jgi:hypothetical protein
MHRERTLQALSRLVHTSGPLTRVIVDLVPSLAPPDTFPKFVVEKTVILEKVLSRRDSANN